MKSKVHCIRLQIPVSDEIEKKAIELKWSNSFIISDILTEVIQNKRVPSYFASK